MERKDVLKSVDYWTTKIQLDLYQCAVAYMQKSGKNKTQLAKHLGVSKGYVSQLLNGDYDHRLSKMVELSLAFGFVPNVSFKHVEDVISEDRFEHTRKHLRTTYTSTKFTNSTIIDCNEYLRVKKSNETKIA